jgi:large subunit ribosomal protein L21
VHFFIFRIPFRPSIWSEDNKKPYKTEGYGSMFAVIQTGGKQYKVASAQTLLVEKLPGNAGETVKFDKVLLVGGEGAPADAAGATVSAEIIDQVKGDKVIIFKKKRRHTYRRKNGHRQQLTLLRITEIAAGGKVLAKAEAKAAAAKPAKKVAVETEEAPAKAAAPKKAPAAKKPAAKKAEGETATKKAAPKKAASKKE